MIIQKSGFVRELPWLYLSKRGGFGASNSPFACIKISRHLCQLNLRLLALRDRDLCHQSPMVIQTKWFRVQAIYQKEVGLGQSIHHLLAFKYLGTIASSIYLLSSIYEKSIFYHWEMEICVSPEPNGYSKLVGSCVSSPIKKRWVWGKQFTLCLH